ncbi:glucose dehydrogenase [FAD, quinone]-like [Battus philenor]|uniref:glucose dehydrogenase [FAD, quinone]-like n=1 Tax=Battus philenor TaxID=42288 RepID=UPI0035CEBBCA
MANMNWIPPDVSTICSETVAPLTQCSQTGFMFLTLVARLFGGSVDKQENLPVNPYTPHHEFGYSNDLSNGFPGKSENQLTAFSQLGPDMYNHDIQTETLTSALGPILQTDMFPKKYEKPNNNEQRLPGIQSFSTGEFYTGPEFEFESGTFSNPFEKYDRGRRDFNERGSYTDSDTANSENIEVKKYKKDRKKRNKRNVHEYDFIIVGAGSAGCVIANRLSEVKKWKILLLEAGPEEPDVTSVPSLAPTLGRSSIDWMYRTQPEELTCRAQRGQTCAWLSGRVMGGSSAINYLVYMRGNKKDYDDWAALGNKGWSYNNVLPYFIKSENNRDIEAKDKTYHGVNGPLNVERFSNMDKNIPMLIDAFNEFGLPLVDFNGERQIGTMTTQTTSRDGKRVSTNTAFVRPVRRKRKNLIVSTDSQVIKILIKPDSLRAYGVKYLRNGVFKRAFAKKEIIISAGALNSPKLLLLSGVGPKEHLKSLGIPVYKDLKVGHNLQDHATTDAFLMKLSNKTSTSINSKQVLSEVLKYYKQKNGLLAATGPLQITAFIRTKYADNDETVPDIQFHFDGRHMKDFYSDPTTYLASNVLPLAYYDSINVRPILLLPKSRGYLTLNKTNPVFGQPLIFPNFFTDKRDVDTLVAALRYAIKLENTKSFKKNQVSFIRVPVKACERYKWGSYDYFVCLLTRYTATIFHPSGTCKMGPKDDNNAVVDNKLRVYGIKKLRVADASIMPNIVRGNTNAPVIMIGEKLSDMIKESWGV